MQKISTITATAVGLGAIIGAGIFVLSGTAIAQAGADALLAFILVGAVALIIALELGELSTLFPKLTGASYSYVYEAFGSELGFIIGIMLYFSFATAISVVALGFGSYFASLVGAQLGANSIQLFAIALIIALSALTVAGVKRAARADLGLVVIKIIALLVFIGFALIYAFHGSAFSLHNFSVSASQGTASAFFAASIVIFFAYTGFQAIVTLTPRIKGGGRSAAKATILSVVISMVLYIAIVAVLMLLMPASQFTVSGDPLAAALSHVSAPSWISIVVGVGALVATASATLAMMIAASNQLHQVGKDGLLPRVIRGYNKKRGVSTKGVVVTAVIAMIMLFSGNIFVVAAISNFGLLMAFLMTGFALMHFRRRRAEPEFKMPLYPYLPVVGIIAILLFIIGMPKTALIIGTIMVLSLIAIYYTLREMAGKRVVKVKIFR